MKPVTEACYRVSICTLEVIRGRLTLTCMAGIILGTLTCEACYRVSTCTLEVTRGRLTLTCIAGII